MDVRKRLSRHRFCGTSNYANVFSYTSCVSEVSAGSVTPAHRRHPRACIILRTWQYVEMGIVSFNDVLTLSFCDAFEKRSNGKCGATMVATARPSAESTRMFKFICIALAIA